MSTIIYPREIAQLSSGTMATLLADGPFSKYDRELATNGYVIDAWQRAFALWQSQVPAMDWRVAWQAYLTDRQTPEFVCGYAGATDYRWMGARFEVRRSCMGSGFCWSQTPYDYWKLGIQKKVGTVIRDSDVTKWPPLRFVSFFPGYVASRLNPDYENLPPEQYIEYHPELGAPDTVPDKLSKDGIRAKIDSFTL